MGPCGGGCYCGLGSSALFMREADDRSTIPTGTLGGALTHVFEEQEFPRALANAKAGPWEICSRNVAAVLGPCAVRIIAMTRYGYFSAAAWRSIGSWQGDPARVPCQAWKGYPQRSPPPINDTCRSFQPYPNVPDLDRTASSGRMSPLPYAREPMARLTDNDRRSSVGPLETPAEGGTK